MPLSNACLAASLMCCGVLKSGSPNESEITFEEAPRTSVMTTPNNPTVFVDNDEQFQFAETVEEEEILKLEQKEIEMIKKSLEKNKGKRKAAADELGISERTLYRKIKQFDL